MTRHLRIAQVAPPLVSVPPPGYGGTERIVAELVAELVRRGHDVTTFAPGDSTVRGRLVPTVPRALWSAGDTGDPAPWFLSTLDRVLERQGEFDIIHSHLEWYSVALARGASVPVVTTFHGRLDVPWAAGMLATTSTAPVAISHAQRSAQPDARWAGVVHNGLSLRGMPFGERAGDDLAFVGRLAPDKGVAEAIDVALLAGRRLRIAAKSGTSAIERNYLEAVFRPALTRAGSAVEWLGELSIADRDRLYADSAATLMPGAWPEPFGLVAIESLATGTPVVARHTGALPEIVRDGRDGFLAHDLPAMAAAIERVGELDRATIRGDVLHRFSAERMADGYEAVFDAVLVAPGARGGLSATGIAVGPGARPRRAPIVVRGVGAEPAGTPSDPDPGTIRQDASSGARSRG